MAYLKNGKFLIKKSNIKWYLTINFIICFIYLLIKVFITYFIQKCIMYGILAYSTFWLKGF